MYSKWLIPGILIIEKAEIIIIVIPKKTILFPWIFLFFLELQASNDLIQGIILKLFPIKIIIHSDNLIQKHSN